ncbi:CoA ester lyase [Parafrigoribacterium mesophilum]|uniref:HpcH/HpaI aldolase/citrate lyase family protein n=1 Tax=Parafrigoribacterium mesophilum TaxID=433646 RepID=UPI0031FBA751
MESAPRSRSPRSYLYVPGDQEGRLSGASGRGADALILDLEDSVPMQNKAGARELVAGWLAHRSAPSGELWVRINSTSPEPDIAAVVLAGVTGVMIPKAEPELLQKIDQLLSDREHSLQLRPGTVRVIPLIETARGLLAAVEQARMPRVLRLAIGRADLAGELGLGVDPEGDEFRPLLLQIVVASAAAGIAAPVAPTSTDFHDLGALRDSTQRLLNLGFRGRSAIHPAQLETINAVFTPSADAVERAERLVAAFDAADRAGSGVITDEDGRMVDVAVVRSARELLSRAPQQTDADHHTG